MPDRREEHGSDGLEGVDDNSEDAGEEVDEGGLTADQRLRETFERELVEFGKSRSFLK